MATFKHISSKNADYGAAEQYLTFEHDEFSMKPVLDERGHLIEREDYRISSLNCGDEDFAISCMRANLRYGKNQKKEDVKSHHYIISFDPRDGPDNGLTVDRAQELGEQFCRDHFPGHQALVCTHPDGHNKSGNILCISSSIPYGSKKSPLPYMDRPADTRAGCKHRCTDAAMEYFRAEVMQMCQKENLYQIDLLHGSKNRITEWKYWAKKKGQRAIDLENETRRAEGKPLNHTKFETDKERLRRTIRRALDKAKSFDEFSSLLLQEGVTVKESRGRYSYLTPDWTKPITARRLGDDFDKSAILETCARNAVEAQRATKEARGRQSLTGSSKGYAAPTNAGHATPKRDGLQRMVDIEAKRAEGKGIGYEKWAKVFNLKQMAATLAAYQEQGFSSPEELDAAYAAASSAYDDSRTALKALETELAAKKELQGQVLSYVKTKPVRDGLKAVKSPKKREEYRREHESDFIIAESASRYFKAHGIEKLPKYKTLQTEIEQLTARKNAAYNDYREKKDRYQTLLTVKRNIEQMTQGAHSQRRTREPER